MYDVYAGWYCASLFLHGHQLPKLVVMFEFAHTENSIVCVSFVRLLVVFGSLIPPVLCTNTGWKNKEFAVFTLHVMFECQTIKCVLGISNIFDWKTGGQRMKEWMRGEHIHFKYALGLRLPIHTTVEPHFVLVIRCAKLNLNQSNEFNSKVNFFFTNRKIMDNSDKKRTNVFAYKTQRFSWPTDWWFPQRVSCTWASVCVCVYVCFGVIKKTLNIPLGMIDICLWTNDTLRSNVGISVWFFSATRFVHS